MATEPQTCALVAINNAGRPGLKWRDTLHEIRDTNMSFYAKQTQFDGCPD